ncbi:MAG: lytic transglycosylase domain-containing protein [Pseudomonadota bacterium]
MLDFLLLTQQCAPHVAPETMAAIVRTESQFQPLAIGINGGARLVRQPATKKEAVITAKSLIGQGYNIDLGLGQVNSSNLAKTSLSIEDAFDPCRNLAASSSILKNNYERARQKQLNSQEALFAALSAYNTGNFSKGFTNGYVQKVVANAEPIKPIAIIPALKPQILPVHKPKQNTVSHAVQVKVTPPTPQEKASNPLSPEDKKLSWDVFNDF